MRLAHHVQPLRAVRLAADDLVARRLGEDLRAAAGHGVEAGVAQLGQDLLDGHPVELVEEVDLDRGEGLHVDVGPDVLDAAHHVREVRPRQVGMQAADDVHLAHLLGQRGHVLEDVVERHRVGARLVLLGREGAEVAGGRAHVRVVDVRVPDEVGGVAVPGLARVVGEAGQAEEVVRLVEGHAVRERQPLAGQDLVPDGAEGGVADTGRDARNAGLSGRRGSAQVLPSLSHGWHAPSPIGALAQRPNAAHRRTRKYSFTGRSSVRGLARPRQRRPVHGRSRRAGRRRAARPAVGWGPHSTRSCAARRRA